MYEKIFNKIKNFPISKFHNKISKRKSDNNKFLERSVDDPKHSLDLKLDPDL